MVPLGKVTLVHHRDVSSAYQIISCTLRIYFPSLMTSNRSVFLLPSSTRKRNTERSDSIRSMGVTPGAIAAQSHKYGTLPRDSSAPAKQLYENGKASQMFGLGDWHEA